MIQTSQKTCFFAKVTFEEETKKPPAGMLATEVRIGDAPKPPFSTNTYEIKKVRKSTSRQP